MTLVDVWTIYLTLVVQLAAGYPYAVEVTDIRSTTATLQWKSTEMMVEQFLIKCKGSQQYKTLDGQVDNTEIHSRLQYVPRGLTKVIVGSLRPFYNYSCTIEELMEEGAQVFHGNVSELVVFSTDVTDPEKFQAPKISKEDGITYVWLRELEKDKKGPVDGYSIQFHYIDDPVLDDIPVELDLSNPFGKLAPVDVEYARVSNQPLSFQILFKQSLPERIHIDQDLMSGALKNGAIYRVLVVPYVQSRSAGILYTPSRASVSFVAVGIDHNAFEPKPDKDKPTLSTSVKLAISLGIILPAVCFIYMIFVSIIVIIRGRILVSRRKDLENSGSRFRSCKKCVGSDSTKMVTMHDYCLLGCTQCCRHRNGFELLKLEDSGMSEDDMKFYKHCPSAEHSANPKLKKNVPHKFQSTHSKALSQQSTGKKKDPFLHEKSTHGPERNHQLTTPPKLKRDPKFPHRQFSHESEKKLKSMTSQTSMPYQITHVHRENPKLEISSPCKSAYNPRLDPISPILREQSTHEFERDLQSIPPESSQHRSTHEPRKLEPAPIIPHEQIVFEASPTHLHQQSTPKPSPKCLDPQRIEKSNDKSISKTKSKNKRKDDTIFGYFIKKHRHPSKRCRKSQSGECDPLIDASTSIPGDERSWDSPSHSFNTTNESVSLSPVQSKQSCKNQKKRNTPKIMEDYQYSNQHYVCSESKHHDQPTFQNHQGSHQLHDLRSHSRISFHSPNITAHDRPTPSHSKRTLFSSTKPHQKCQELNVQTAAVPNSSGTGNQHCLNPSERKSYSMVLNKTTPESTLVPEETKILEYTTSTSVLEKPFHTDNFYSPCESDIFMGEWKKSTKNTDQKAQIEKVDKASSTDGLEYISLSSSSQTDGKVFGNLDILH